MLSRELAQRGQYPAIDVGASLSRVMNDIVDPDHVELARRFRALSSAYESNRDLVLMGAYRPGADTLGDRAIAMHTPLTELLCQPTGQMVRLDQAQDQLSQLLGHEG